MKLVFILLKFFMFCLFSDTHLVNAISQSSSSFMFQNLLKWAENHNATISKIEIKQITHDNRYFIASTDILEGEVINSIPISMCYEVGHPELRPIFSKINRIPELRSLSLFIRSYYTYYIHLVMNLNNTQSFFYPYFKSLPQKVDEYPQTFSKKQLKKLKNSFLIDWIHGMKNRYIKIKRTLLKYFPQLERFRDEDFLRSVILVDSRIFEVWTNKETKQLYLMVPISDLFNHKEKRNAKWRFNDRTNSFEIFTTRPIKKGEEIFIRYENDELLRFSTQYGFIPNVERFVNEKFEFVDKTYALVAKSKNISTEISLNYNGTLIFDHLHIYRQLLSSNQNGDKNVFKSPVSLANEISSLNTIKRVLKVRLANYPTSLQHDKNLINSRGTSFKDKSILRVLIEEKKALLNTILKLELAQKILANYQVGKINIIKRSLIEDEKFISYFETLRNSISVHLYYE